MTTISKRDVHRSLRVIRPECVTGLTLDDRETTAGQVGLFRSLIDIDLLARLRSLFPLGIEERDLCRFVEQARKCSLVSLTLDSTCRGIDEEQERIAEHLSSIIVQPTFLRLQLFSRDRCLLCKLQYLKIEFFTENQVSKILLRVSDIQSLVLDRRMVLMLHNSNDTGEIPLISHPRLTSLTISSHSESIHSIRSFLSFTRCLCHRKIIDARARCLDGSRREEFIKTKLPALNKFEFYTCFFFD